MYEPLTPNTQTQLVDLYFSKMCDQTIILVNSFESKKKKKRLHWQLITLVYDRKPLQGGPSNCNYIDINHFR